MSRPYRPSSGCEGLDFKEEFCFRCRKYGADDKPEEHCPIEDATYINTTDPLYPKEWVQDENGARCTAFEEEK